MKRDFPFSIIVSVILAVMIADYVFTWQKVFTADGILLSGTIGRLDAVILILLFIAYLAFTVLMALKNKVEDEEIAELPAWKCAVYILGGAAAIIIGGQLVVNSAKTIALACHMTETLVGLTIVAMGTSLPETAVSVTASLVDNNTLAISNVVGSNIFNLMFVIGVCSILSTIYVQRETVTRDIPFSIICALLLLGLGMIAVGDASGMTLGHFDGILFLILFAGYIGLMIKSAMKARAEGKEVESNDEFDAEELKVMSYPKSIIYIVGGAIAIAIGGDLTVDTASRIAIDLGMSQTLVGLTIVSIGTSLPELVTSVVAARKNEVDMAVCLLYTSDAADE